jgi:hypothetical protein
MFLISEMALILAKTAKKMTLLQRYPIVSATVLLSRMIA